VVVAQRNCLICGTVFESRNGVARCGICQDKWIELINLQVQSRRLAIAAILLAVLSMVINYFEVW